MGPDVTVVRPGSRPRMMRQPHPGPAMPPSPSAARRVLVLCGLIPLHELTQAEVDDLFRRAVEDAPPLDPPADLGNEMTA